MLKDRSADPDEVKILETEEPVIDKRPQPGQDERKAPIDEGRPADEAPRAEAPRAEEDKAEADEEANAPSGEKGLRGILRRRPAASAIALVLLAASLGAGYVAWDYGSHFQIHRRRLHRRAPDRGRAEGRRLCHRGPGDRQPACRGRRRDRPHRRARLPDRRSIRRRRRSPRPRPASTTSTRRSPCRRRRSTRRRRRSGPGAGGADVRPAAGGALPGCWRKKAPAPSERAAI